MNNQSMFTKSQADPPDHPQAKLERFYIEEHLKSKGTSLKKISKLPRAIARALMIEACMYASNKLAELETRSRLVDELHGDF